MPRRHALMLSCLLSISLLASGVRLAGSGEEGAAHRQNAIMSLHPTAYWPLNEETIEQVVRDRTQNQNNGFYEGARAAAAGSLPGGRAALFGVPGINLTNTHVAVQGND